MYNRTIEQCVMSYAIRYQRLSELVGQSFQNSEYASSTTLNLYIDLTRIIRNCNEIVANDPLALSANILNLCAHYKSFFRRGYGVECKIFLLYTSGEFFFNKQYYHGYGFPGNQIILSNTTKTNLDLLTMIVRYLPDIDFITTDQEVGLVMMDIMQYEAAHGNPSPNVIISKDIFLYQIVNSKGTFIFRPKKVETGDVSYAINKSNVIDIYQIDRKIKFVENSINPEMLSFIMAITKVPERQIPTIISIGTAIKLIEKCIKDNTILNGYINDCNYCTLEISKRTKSNIVPFEVSIRYKAVDLVNLYMSYDYNLRGNARYNGIINLVDPMSLNMINEQYYQKTPVDFITLM